MRKQDNFIGVLRTPGTARGEGRVCHQRCEAESVIDIFPLHRGKVEELRGASHVFVFYPLASDAEKSHPATGECSGTAAGRSPIGRSVLRLSGIIGSLLVVQGIDMLDRTPILDIRPFRVDSRLCYADSLY